MNNKKLALLAPALLLAACGGEEQSINEALDTGSVVYSYPADGQVEVSPRTELVLRFSHAISDEDAASKIRVASDAGPVDFDMEAIDEGRSLVLRPRQQLATGEEYTVSFSETLSTLGSTEIGTPNAIGAEGIQFTTRASFSGVQQLASLGDSFQVEELTPSADGFFQPMDISTFRLRLTQPAHPDSVVYGTTVALRDSDDNLVPASVLAKGRHLSIDPCTTDEPADCGSKADQLTPGETYTLSVSGLVNLDGETIADFSQSFTPRETGPTEILFQETVDSGFALRSVLNGQFVNAVTLNSVLQGTAGPSQQTGALYAELAYAPLFPGDDPVPLRVPKGTVLESTSLDVLINGRVPVINEATGQLQTTGTIKVTMVSDASGYLYPNPYSDSEEAPRHVKLFMDVAMNTEQAQPNASLSQDLLRVELSGIAFVTDGILNIDAIGMVEPNLLGQEFTDSTIAFRLRADTAAQVSAPPRPMDQAGPELVSWMPGPENATPSTRQDMQRPGDPIVLNFDEPLDRDSLVEGLVLMADGTEVPQAELRRRLDGTAVVLNPVGGLKHGVHYNLQINSSLTDLAGNAATSRTLTFSLPAISDGTEAGPVSPLALTTYPGFPCVSQNLDLVNGSHGTCVDSGADSQGTVVRDQLPLMTLPEDRAIVVKFSQSMDLGSINPSSFVVEKVADPASPAPVGSEEVVTGRLEKKQQLVRFYPDQAWEVDAVYRYTMRSAVNGASDCDTGTLVCSAAGLPLQTDLLVDPADIGGPDLTIYFKGSEAVSSVFTPLRNLPIRDTNSNYVIDCGTAGGTDCLEPFAHAEDGNGGFLPSANSTALRVVDGNNDGVGESSAGPARVGCSPDNADCPRNKFIYQTYALDTEVIGPKLDENGNAVGVRVLLYPTQLATTSATVIVSANLAFGSDITSATGTQILRMTYGEPTEDNPMGLVEGVIKEGPDGDPIFETVADLTLDAPNLSGVDSHDVYSKPVQLKLQGKITFFDDGRMQIEQRNTEISPITVNATSFGFVGVEIPLEIPEQGVYLNFISNPIKEIPEEG